MVVPVNWGAGSRTTNDRRELTFSVPDTIVPESVHDDATLAHCGGFVTASTKEQGERY
jgi:hypothetical protein